MTEMEREEMGLISTLLDANQVNEIVELYDIKEKSVRDIAMKFKVSTTLIYRQLREYGLI